MRRRCGDGESESIQRSRQDGKEVDRIRTVGGGTEMQVFDQGQPK